VLIQLLIHRCRGIVETDSDMVDADQIAYVDDAIDDGLGGRVPIRQCVCRSRAATSRTMSAI
jgi:hypothetical protein